MLNDPHSPRLASHGFRRRKLGTVGPYPESQCTASPSTAETTVDRRHNLASASLSFSTSGDHDAVLATSAEGKTKENTKEEHNSSRHSMVRVALVGGEGGGGPSLSDQPHRPRAHQRREGDWVYTEEVLRTCTVPEQLRGIRSQHRSQRNFNLGCFAAKMGPLLHFVSRACTSSSR
jgi:hypothetical protein